MVSRSASPLNDPRPDPGAIWERAKEILRDSLDKTAYKTWIADTHAIELRGGVLHVGVPSVFKLEALRGSYYQAMSSALRQAAGRPMEIELRVATQPEQSAAALDPPPTPMAGDKPQKSRRPRTRPHLDSRYTFDRFVVGPSNEYAATMAQRVATHPGQDANPLFIYSDVGLGKTHLLTAIGNALDPRPDLDFDVVNTEFYLRAFIRAAGSGRRAEFQEKYESLDVLVLDDIQKLGDKPGTQDEFFNVFNALHQQGKQIVIAADTPPRRLSGLSERLVTRFESGFQVEITHPDIELRSAILQRRASDMGLAIDEPLLQLLAEIGGKSIRTMVGALDQVRLTAQLKREPITAQLVHEALANRVPEEQRLSKPTIADLIAAASDVTGVPPELFTSGRKDQRTSRARHLVMHQAYRHLGMTQQEIGRALGGRHHTTVLNGIGKVDKMLQNPSAKGASGYVQQISELQARLRLDR